MTRPTKILCVVGARPNFMKIAPIMRAFAAVDGQFQATLVHTGQHYDKAMKESFFDQLHIPEPDVDLGVGSGSHTEQTANIMLRFEPVLDEFMPDALLVVGDVNSTIACALVAVKKNIPIIHVESGLRSGDRAMPEEINRILTDQLSDLLFTTERLAAANLAREGIAADKVHFVGNVMIDTLRFCQKDALPAASTFADAGFGPFDRYGLITLHRPSNVDDESTLRRLLSELASISAELPLVFPVHPRTRSRIDQFGLARMIEEANIHLLPPQGYLEMLGLMQDASVVFTDSGGLQEETTALGVPCITLRESTERPITAEEGTNTVVGTDPVKIREVYDATMAGKGKAGRQPEFWDGNAASRIAKIIRQWHIARSA